MATADPAPLRASFHADFTYAGGDATNLYNSASEGSTAVAHASRDLVWLKPDWVVVFDRGGCAQRPLQAGLVAIARGGHGERLAGTRDHGWRPAALHHRPVARRGDDASGGPRQRRRGGHGGHPRADDAAGDGASARRGNGPLPAPGPGGGWGRIAHAGHIHRNGQWVRGAGGEPNGGALQRGLGPARSANYATRPPQEPAGIIITGLPANAGYAVTVAETAAGVTVTILPGGSTPADDAGVLVLPARPRTSAFLPLITVGP